ncbi:MAG: cell division protein FtsZ [Duncaniella sp.]|nr:cell division protein FtsZ [Duncaniella sp.]
MDYNNHNNSPIDDSSAFKNDDQKEVIIKAIGVGGGGNNAVNHMYREGIKSVSFVNINTDRQALRNSAVPNTLEIGDGLGAGNKPEKASAFAEDSAEEIAALFDDDTKMVFITAGMGGGTGTGAAPVVARIAKERGLLTIGIVTIPFLFEGQKKIKKAIAGADEMAKYVDALLVINNERLTEIYGDLDFVNAFGKADDTLSIAARSISEIITIDGYMNLDFNDVDTTLRAGGAAIISSGYGEGEQRVTKAIQDALNSPLLKNRDILGSKRLLFNLYFSREAEDKFLISETNEITDFISTLNPEVDVIWGVSFDDTLGDMVKMTILAAGFDVTISEEEDDIIRSRKAVRKPQPPVFGSPVSTPPTPSAQPQPQRHQAEAEKPEISVQRIKQEYGDDLAFRKERASYIVLGSNQLDDDMVCDTLERTPTYKRDKRVAEELRAQASTRPADPRYMQPSPLSAPQTSPYGGGYRDPMQGRKIEF